MMGLGRLGEAMRECEEAVKLDPNYVRAHWCLASLCPRWSLVCQKKTYFCFSLIDCFGLGVYLWKGNNKSFMIDF